MVIQYIAKKLREKETSNAIQKRNFNDSRLRMSSSVGVKSTFRAAKNLSNIRQGFHRMLTGELTIVCVVNRHSGQQYFQVK